MAAVKDLLRKLGVWHLRMQTGAMRPGGRFVSFGTPGCADLLASVNAKFLWIETKRPGGKVSADQIVFRKIVELQGHDYIVAESTEPVIEYLKKVGRL